MDKSIVGLFRKTGESLQAIYEYFRLKDKVLWTGSASGGQTITVPDIGKYNSISMFINNIQVLCQETAGNQFYGSVINSSEDAREFYARTVYAKRISDDSIKIIIATQSGVNISVGSQVTIAKIIGVNPKLPETLQNIVGGATLYRSLLFRGCVL